MVTGIKIRKSCQGGHLCSHGGEFAINYISYAEGTGLGEFVIHRSL